MVLPPYLQSRMERFGSQLSSQFSYFQARIYSLLVLACATPFPHIAALSRPATFTYTTMKLALFLPLLTLGELIKTCVMAREHASQQQMVLRMYVTKKSGFNAHKNRKSTIWRAGSLQLETAAATQGPMRSAPPSVRLRLLTSPLECLSMCCTARGLLLLQTPSVAARGHVLQNYNRVREHERDPDWLSF